jgi:signal transduction histidine kinase
VLKKQPTTDELAEELAQKSAEISTLQQVSSDINSTLELEDIYDIVLRTMDELFGFHHALILLLDDSGKSLTVAASRGYEDDTPGGKVAVGTGLIGVVAKKRRMMRVSNLGRQRGYIAAIRKQMEDAGRADELGEATPVPGLPNVESQIAIPLMIKDNLIGVFSVESAEKKVYSESDEVLVTIVANQAASAIHNARLVRAAEHRRRELAEAHESLKRLNETLEERVRARTAELEQTNRELRETQAQLVQSAKMASLGTLVAGVAHEINTPIGSISANTDLVKRASQIVKQRFEAEDAPTGHAEDKKLRQAIETLEQASETELLACNRISSIVRSLRNFARLDESEEKLVDIHEGIDSTLILLRHELKTGIEVVKRFGDLPKVLCYPSQLNQVFMNLLTNAVVALQGQGKITITTAREGDDVLLSFADTGTGIPLEDLERIFDPGFTTKGVGVGTGLGLSICYRIVQDHRGSIQVTSDLGKGTQFTVRLPISR